MPRSSESGSAVTPHVAIGIGACLRNNAIHSPNAAAVIDATGQISHFSLHRASVDCALRLHDLGIKSGDRVAVIVSKDIDSICWLLGALRAGAIAVPLNPRLKIRQLVSILDHCSPTVLICGKPQIASVQAITRLAKVPLVVEPPEARIIRFDTPSNAIMPSALPSDTLVDDTPSAILYTSGSTGRPKGILLSHSNLTHGAASVASFLSLSVTDRILAIPPLSFDYGLNQLLSSLRVCASVVLADYRFPQSVFSLIERHRVTGLPGVPALLDKLATCQWPVATRNLRYLTNTGGRLAPGTVRLLSRMLPNTDIHLMYGFTEAFRATSLPPDLARDHPESIGFSVPYAEVRVVRPDGTECDTDEPGELIQSGELLAIGYYNDADASAARWRSRGLGSYSRGGMRWAWSGDIVSRDAKGLLKFLSRSDDMVKLSGYRTYPAEIEYAIRDGAPVLDVCVSCPCLPDRGTVAVVDVVLEAGRTTDDVLCWCRKELPNYQVPHDIRAHSVLPTGINGKVDRKELLNQWDAQMNKPDPSS